MILIESKLRKRIYEILERIPKLLRLRHVSRQMGLFNHVENGLIWNAWNFFRRLWWGARRIAHETHLETWYLG